MHRTDDGAVERTIQVPPLARRRRRSEREAHRGQHRADARRVRGENLAEQCDGRQIAAGAGTRDRALFGFKSGEAQHGAGQNVLGLGMGRHAEARHVDPDHADAVDLLGQPIQRHARRGRHAKVDHDDRVQIGRLGQRVDGVADVFVELATNQRLGIERHVADRPPGSVEMRRERQPIDAASGPTQDRRDPAHPQPDAQRPKRRAHRLRLIVRTLRVIGGQPVEDRAFAGCPRGRQHGLATRMTTTGARRQKVRQRVHQPMRPRRPLRGTDGRAGHRRTCRPRSPGSTCSRGRRPRP